MTVGIYIRVSTEEQSKEGFSIPAQKEKLTLHCMSQGWDDYKFYIDEGISAKNTNRPQLQQLLNDVKTNKIHLILVWRLDRFTRSVRDLYTLLDMLDKYNCAFKSATEMYDTSNAIGRMFIGLVALLAQWEVENLSERVKMALEEKVSSGERVGGIPFGFDLNEKEKLVANEKSKIIIEMINMLKSGKSVNAIAQYLTKTNEDKLAWHPNTVFRLLRNPALYGSTKWNDEVYENTHEGIITKMEFLKIQQVLDDHSLHPRRDVESTYIFQGVLSCPRCGNPLSVNRYIRKRKDGTEYQGAVYRCQICYNNGHGMLSIGEKRFEEALYDYMKTVEVKPEKPIKEPDNEKEVLEKQLKQVERKREKYQKAWAADLISDEEFEQRMEETRSIYEELKGKINTIATPVKIDTEALKKIVFTFNQSFSYLTQEEKKMFVSQFIRKIEFKLIPQPPKNYKNKKGKELVVFTDIQFY